MSQMQMPSGIMWGQRPGQPPYNPAPTGQNPQMLGMGPQMGGPPQGQQPPGMGQYPSLMQNAMQGGAPAGAPSSSYAPAPTPNWQGSQGTPQSPWTGNNIGSQPMGGQTPGMGNSTPDYANMPQMPSGPIQGGSPYGANGQMSRTPTTIPGQSPMLMGNVLPGGGAPPPRPRWNNMAGGSQYPALAQNALNQQATPGGGSGGPIPAPSDSPPVTSGAPTDPSQSGYAGGGNSGGIGVGVPGASSDPATLQSQMTANAAAFQRASQTQGNNNTRNNFNPAAAGIGQPMQTGLAGIPTPGATYNPNGGASLAAPSATPQWNPWGGGPRPAQQWRGALRQ